MTPLRAAAQAALEALTFDGFTPEDSYHRGMHAAAIDALRAALAQPTQPQGEPVAWICRTGHGTGLRAEKPTGDVMPFWTPLYTTPQRVAQPLTSDQIDQIACDHIKWGAYSDSEESLECFARAIEAAHGIGAAAQIGGAK